MESKTRKYDIVYINLDEKPERKISMEKKLIDIYSAEEFERFSAIKGDDRECGISRNELGCFLSHQTIIENSSKSFYTLVLEDDVILSRNFRKTLDNLLTSLEKDSVDWDILFLAQMTDIKNLSGNSILLDLKSHLKKDGEYQKYVTLDTKQFYLAACSSYVINPKSKNKISDILNDYAERKYPLAIDICFKQELRKSGLIGKFIFPYIVGLENKGDSSIQTGNNTIGSRLLEDQLNLFFVDANIDEIYNKYKNQNKLIESNKEKHVYSQILFNQISVYRNMRKVL